MKAMLVLAVLLCATPASAEWTWTDTTLQASYGALVTADFLMTREALASGAGREANPLLGQSSARIGLTLGGMFAAHTAVAALLPKAPRRIVQFAGIAASGFVVGRALYMGYGVSF